MTKLTKWQDIEKEFNEKVSELRKDLGSEKIYYFGYKDRRGDELYVVVDWGNVKAFLRSTLKGFGKEMVGKDSKCEDYIEGRPCACDGYNQRGKEIRNRIKEWGL